MNLNRDQPAGLADLVTEALASADIHAFAWDTDSGDILWSPHADSVLGPIPASGRFPSPLVMACAEDLQQLKHDLRKARDADGRVLSMFRLTSTDGINRWVRLRGRFEPPASPRPGLLRGIIVDTNERHSREIDAQRKLYEYRQVLDSLPDRVWSKDLSGRFTTVNRAYTEFSDMSREEIVGDTNRRIIPGSMAAQSAEEDIRVIEHGLSTRSENNMVSRGRTYRFEVLKSPLRDEDGNIIGVTGVTHDITLRHALQETLAKTNQELESLLASCPTGICIVRHRTIERCNPAAAAMLGYTPEELIGKPTRFLYPEEESWRLRGQKLYPKDRPHQITSMEVEFQRKDGSRVWVLVITNVINSAEEYAVGSWVDITEQRKLSQAMVEARDAADAANRAKSTFLATMSHEIRTPMYGVLGMLELLEKSRLDAEQRESLQVVRDSANSLLGLIDGVLDFSKIEAGQLDINAVPFDLRQVASQCLILHQEVASRRGLQLKSEIDGTLPPSLIGDSLRIRQIISNLLSNAIKFTPRGTVTLTIRRAMPVNRSLPLTISVTDTGIGIDAAAQARLFQPFVQADTGTTRRFGGTGLGLVICRRLAEAMGGTLTLWSAPAEGTRVTLELALAVNGDPAPRAAAPAGGQAAAVQPRSPRLRLLVAEDHPVNLRMLARQLDQLGFDADLAKDGAEALRLWRSGSYAALISDCHMPDMDGFELAREVRAAEAGRGVRKPIPIIACTASAMAEEGEQCLAAGMNDVMVKPVSLATLRAHLAKWLPEPDDSPA